MEESVMKGMRFREMTSSELQLTGGVKSSGLMKVVEKIRNVIDFICDYIPKIVKGFSDGLLGARLF